MNRRNYMKTNQEPNALRHVGWLSAIALIFTFLFFVMFISDIVTNGVAETREEILSHVENIDWLFYSTYINAALITISATMLMLAIAVYCKPLLPKWLFEIGKGFIPVYCVLNLFAYLSQVTLVPLLLELRGIEEYTSTSEVILLLVIQTSSVSVVAFFNNLAYAILGIPSIIFGYSMYKKEHDQMQLVRYAGLFLILNGVACIIGIIGILLHSQILGMGSLVGALFYLVSLVLLVPLSWKH